MSVYKTYEEYRSAWNNSVSVDMPVPGCVDLELASLCGLSCPSCYWGESKFQSDMNGEGVMSKQLMPTDLAMRLIDEAFALGVPSMKFHGRGDGIHHRDYVKILKHAKSKKDNPAFAQVSEILVNTHGNKSRTKIDGLMCADKVMISLDSTVPSRYERMRKGGRFGDVAWTIEELLSRGHQNVWVRRIITDENKDEDFVGEVRKAWPKAHPAEHYAFNLRNRDVNVAAHHEDESAWARTYCQYPSVRLVVLATGDVVPCCVDWRAEMVVGNVNQQSLKDIWGSAPIQKLRTELRAGTFTSAICKACTSFQAYSRPEREFVADHEGKAVLA